MYKKRSEKTMLSWKQLGFHVFLGLLPIIAPRFVLANGELAKVNGHSITEQDVQYTLGGLNSGQRNNLLSDENSKRQILNGLIDQELLVQEAEKEKLDQDAEFKNAMAAFRKQFLSNRILQKNVGEKATETLAKKFYEDHKVSRFNTDQVYVQHILVKTEAEAKGVLEKVKKGEDFQALAEKISKDPSAKNNRGDLGFISRDRMAIEFTDAAFGAEEGSVVGPIKTLYGYHIIKVIQKKPGKPIGYDEIELRVQNEFRQELTRTYIYKLRAQSKIQVNDQALEHVGSN